MKTAGILVAWMGLCSAQQQSPSIFSLRLPDLFDAPFSGTELISLPDRKIQRLEIVVREAQQRNIDPGKYRITVNGKGLGNVFDIKTAADGAVLTMGPETLRLRPDELFDPLENAIEIVAEDRRGRRFYRSWVLRVNDRQRNSLFGYSSSVSPTDPNGIPPDLILDEPQAPVVFKAGQDAATINVRGRGTPGASVRIDGTAVPSKPGTGAFEYSLALKSARREVVIEAVSAKGNSRKIIIPVLAPPPKPRPRFAGQKYAIVIGVTDFGPAKDAPPRLPRAAAEADEFRRLLESHAGFKPDNVRTLLNADATPEMVRVALSDFSSKAQSNDVLVIYVVSHGVHDPRPDKTDKTYLALHGTQVAALDASAISFSDMEMLLNRSVRTNQCFLVFDIAHPLNENWRFSGDHNLVNNRVLNLFRENPNWSVLVSGSADELSREREFQGKSLGLFNRWLFEGLGGAGDLNGDRVITAGELFQFVAAKVRTESEGAQQPRFRVPSSAAEQAFVQ